MKREPKRTRNDLAKLAAIEEALTNSDARRWAEQSYLATQPGLAIVEVRRRPFERLHEDPALVNEHFIIHGYPSGNALLDSANPRAGHWVIRYRKVRALRVIEEALELWNESARAWKGHAPTVGCIMSPFGVWWLEPEAVASIH